jgi:hypothetical protein
MEDDDIIFKITLALIVFVFLFAFISAIFSIGRSDDNNVEEVSPFELPETIKHNTVLANGVKITRVEYPDGIICFVSRQHSGISCLKDR